MKIVTIAIAIALFFAATGCGERTPFVEKKLELQKVGEDCNQKSASLKLSSNINGERFEFERCLPANFNKDAVKAIRHGDTIIVNLIDTSKAEPNTVFKVTLDIDAYPAYTNLSVDGDNFTITRTKD